MGDLAIPTSWPLPPISPTQAVTSLQRQLKSLRSDIAELTAKAEAAADRTAQVLRNLRSQDEVGLNASNEPASQETQLSLTLRDHPFARFSYHDIAQSQPSASASDAGQSAKVTQQAASLTLHDSQASDKERSRHAMAFSTGSVPEATKVPLYSTYEQSRRFLEVTATVKDEQNRSFQCVIVERRIAKLTAQIAESTSVDACWLIARQIVAYLRFLNLDRVRRSIYEQTRQVPQSCNAWWGKPSDLVEQALARCSLVQEVNDPIFDGIVALVLIHFGVFDISTNTPAAQHRASRDGSPKARRFAMLLKRSRPSRSDPERANSQRRSGKQTYRVQALSVDALVAITELCLQGVFSGAILCDILALFSLGDIDNNFIEVDSDTHLLKAFLHQGLLPRAASIRATFADADPIRDVLDILESMRKLKEAKAAQQANRRSSVHRRMSRRHSSIQVEETEWVPLERFPSSSMSSWSKLPHSPLSKWLPTTKSIAQHEPGTGAQKPITMIDMLNGPL
ncbi:uncharacterized protein SRS1_12781 [Sporisorium reilianum f. sp. reilianum]|uniref:Uncharacterized protein n=1 Tax=Sporisorium reilianum f. sp. reilianum TaxID=72559 RepID=A0A2N8U9T0_9BASI|nr:uncharacterized protein SRS1_12781 [Sporisorium reilianum f. sp. reilianum]